MTARFAAVAIAAASLFIPAAGAAPTWLAPVQVSSGTRAIGPELAVSSSGEELVVWDQELGGDCPTSPAALSCIHIVEASSRAPGAQAWQEPLELDRPGVGSTPRCAVNAGGNAAIIWVHDVGRDRVLQATYRRGRDGSWPEPNDLSTAVLQVRDHHIALDSSGDAVAVWAQRADTTFAVQAEVRSAATGVWGAPVPLSSPGADASGGPALALDGGNEATVAWIENGVVRVVDGSPSGWQTPVSLATGGQGDPDLAVDAAGDAVVVWAAGDSIEAAFRSAGKSWTGPVQIGSAPDSSAAAPRVAIDSSGNAVALWIGARVQSAARMHAAEQWSRPVNVAASGGASAPSLALDTNGNAVAVWVANSTVQAAIRSSALTGWQAPQALASADGSGPRVAMDAVGHAVAVWNSATAANVAVMATELGGGGPLLGPLRVPKGARARTRMTFAVMPGPWASPLSGSPIWRFGDGKSATGVRVKHAYARAGRYEVSVTQADTAGETATATATIKVARRRAVRGH